MRKFLIPLAAAASTIALAAPASAQWYPQPQPQPYGYGYNPDQQPYGHAYGYPANYGQVRAIKQRIDRIRLDLRRLAQYRMISRSEYNARLRDSREIERRFFRNSRDGWGLTPREMNDVQVRIARLEQRIARDIRDGRPWRYRW